MSADEYTCQDCGDTLDVSVCHCGEGPDDPSHRGEGSHYFAPYSRCRCAVALERARAEFASKLATARAEAALAERAALLREIAEGVPSHSFGADASTRAFVDTFVTRELDRLSDRVRARTAPATLSSDTLAAIAEARGLRVVEPELVADVPVLRWECDLHSIARFGQWVLEADAEAWAVWVDSPGPAARLLVAEATTERTERAVNRSAAEDALRKLGVAFRTE